MYRGRGGSGRGRVTKKPLKGLFSDGQWTCNCDPRLPAGHFQTKNGGKHHGRWFYTCQQPQPKKCDLFLWDDEAKAREEKAVLNNSRTEPISDPTTPVKPTPEKIIATPKTGGGRVRFEGLDALQTPSTPSKSSATIGNGTASPLVPSAGTDAESSNDDTQATAVTAQTTLGPTDDDFFDWPASDDEEFGKVADGASSLASSSATPQASRALPETPHKLRKVDIFSTPGSVKRRHDEMEAEGEKDGAFASYPTPISARVARFNDQGTSSMDAPLQTNNDEDVFTTPNTTLRHRTQTAGQELSTAAPPPFPTPTKSNPTALYNDIIAVLSSSTSLSKPTTTALRTICDRHSLHALAVTRGRDASRARIAAQKTELAELEGQISTLKNERDTHLQTIRLMRDDMNRTLAEGGRGRGAKGRKGAR